MTRPSVSSALIGRVSSAVAASSKYSAPYGSSSTISMSARDAHSTSRLRFSRERSRPVGFWKFGTRYRKRTVPSGRALAGQDRLEIVEVDPIGLLLDADEHRLGVLEGADCAGVRRQLHEHDVAGVQHAPADQVDPLLGAGRDEDLLAIRPDAARLENLDRRVDQRLRPPRRPVLQNRRVAAGEQLPRDLLELLPGERRGVRVARRERDHVGHPHRHHAHLADGRSLGLESGVREEPVVVNHECAHREAGAAMLLRSALYDR